MLKLSNWTFVSLVIAPLLAATLGVFWLTSDLMTRVTSKTNIADHDRTKQVVASGFQARKNALGAIVASNAVSDAPYNTTVGTVDLNAIQKLWGNQTRDETNYNFFAILERNNRRPIAAYSKGNPFTADVSAYFKDNIEAIIDNLPYDKATKRITVVTMDTIEGKSIVAVTPAIPASDDIKASKQLSRYLVMSKRLTPEFVRSLGNQYSVPMLKIVPVTGQKIGLTLADQFGAPIGEMRWNDRRPGDVARNEVITKVYFSLGFFSLVMLSTSFLCWLLFRALKRREDAAKFTAEHDALTKLHNRAFLQTKLKQIAEKKTSSFTLAYCDIDGFKDVNDTYNHQVGDLLICHIGKLMNDLAQKHKAVVVRVGGDEFVTVFEGNNSPDEATEFANKVIAGLKEPINIEGNFASVGASIGIAVSQNGETAGTELLRRADVAMYQAKHNGKNRVVEYSPEIEDERLTDQAVLRGLTKIVEDDSIEVVFQPIVDARTREFIAAEALARWPQHIEPHCNPDMFIAIAEKHGLMRQLGDSILKKACLQAVQLPGLRINYNLSTLQLRDPGFANRAISIIKDAGLQPDRFEFEVTESVMINDIGLARKGLERLRASGIKIALDDFGSGYSGIAYLQKLQFDRIKLDRTIVKGISTNTLAQGLVHGSVLMAKGMAAEVTAEGVESEEQAKLLRLAGCNELQGYYFAKPMSEMDFATLVEDTMSKTTHRA